METEERVDELADENDALHAEVPRARLQPLLPSALSNSPWALDAFPLEMPLRCL